MLFCGGRYADAQAQFQKFLDAHPGSSLPPQAALGVATSLDAQGKTDFGRRRLPADHQQLFRRDSVDSARFALAQINERQGNLPKRQIFYEAIVRYNPNGSLGSEAGLRLMELKMKLQSASPATAPAAPFKLNR